MNNISNENINNEILAAKNAAAASTAKVSNLLNDVNNIKNSNIETIKNITDLQNQIYNINNFIDDLIYSNNINHYDFSLTRINHSINTIDASLNQTLSNIINDNISFLVNNEMLMKSDVNYNSSLINKNNKNIDILSTKFDNLVNILNKSLNINIDSRYL